MKPAEWIVRLKQLNPEQAICIHLWKVDDVINKANQMCINIDSNEAQYILIETERNINCSLGISWDTIAYEIEEYKIRRDI